MIFMTKRIVSLLVSFVVLLALSGSVLALDAEREELKASVEENSVGLSPLGELLYEDGYKLFSFAVDDIIDGYRETGSVASIMGTEYKWMVPTDKNEMVTVVPTDDGSGWRISGYTDPGGASAGGPNSAPIDEDALKDEIAEELGQAEEVGRIVSHTHFATFVYLVSGGEEYLVPYAIRPDFTGLTNGEIYTPDEVMNSLEINYGHPVRYNEDGEPLFVGVFDEPKQPDFAWFHLYWIVPLVLLVVGGTGLILWKKKKKD